MKKIFLAGLFFTGVTFMICAAVFAETDQTSEISKKALAAVDQGSHPGDLARPAEKTETVETASQEIPEVKEEEKTGKNTAPAAGKKEKNSKPILPPLAQSPEMEKNWTAFFSKDSTANSVIYTVQVGDSLYVVARKNHTTVDLIKKMNGLTGNAIYVGKKLKLFTGVFSIVVSRSDNTLVLFADGKPIKKYRVSTGKENSTPAGEFKIVDKLVNPTWFKTGAIYPPGSPDNALGTRWLGFDKPAYGIHGTIEPENIGKSVSEGCIRMLNEDVEELYGMVPSGTQVTVKD